jgi:UDPglucose 6-dehydrogenase
LYPGLGYGGSCFPKDTLACIMMGDKAGIEAQLSKSVHAVNQRQRDRFFDKIVHHFGGKTGVGGGPAGLQGRRLAFWGIAFKPRTDDIREAPALTLMRKAVSYGRRPPSASIPSPATTPAPNSAPPPPSSTTCTRP